MYENEPMTPENHHDPSHMNHDEWCHAIREKMHADTPHRLWFAVIDPYADADLPGVIWEYDDHPDVWPLLMTSMDHDVRMRGPLFVRLHDRTRLVDWYLAKSGTQPVGILYALAPEKNDVLFEHLQNLVECSLPDGDAVVFRFYDPRIVRALIELGDTDMQSLVAGPSVAVYGWEFGREKALELHGTNRRLTKEGLALEQPLLDGIARHTMPYAIIDAMGGEQGDYARSLPFHKVFSFVDDVCTTLFNIGISDFHTCTLCTAFAIQAGHNVFSEIQLQKAIRERGKNTTVCDVLSLISDQYLNNIQMSSAT